LPTPCVPMSASFKIRPEVKALRSNTVRWF
jgi:hypothetical protein